MTMCVERYPGGRVSERVSIAIKAESHAVKKSFAEVFQKTSCVVRVPSALARYLP
jgi:hypothetical protein